MVPSAPVTTGGFFPYKRSLQSIGPSILHAAWLRQSFLHCVIFLTAASRRSLVRVSVPVWGIILSEPLPIVVLVSRYLTNKLIGRMLIFYRWNFNCKVMPLRSVMGNLPRFLGVMPQ